MLEAGRLHPRVGAVAAQMRFADRRDVLNSAGLELDRLGIAADRLVGTRVDNHGPRMPYEVFGATGGAAIFKREMLDQVGGFDESFFAFFEDADLAWRAHSHGWRALYAPAAVVYHHHSATAQHGSPAKLYLVGRNRVRTLAKNATAGMLLVNGPWMLAYDAAYVAFASVTGRTLAPLRGRVHGLREWRTLPPQRRARTAARCGCAGRSASGARCSATSATPSTSRSARRRVEHARAHGRRAGGDAPAPSALTMRIGAGARLVPGLPRLRAHRGRDVRRLRARPGRVHLPRRARAAARPRWPGRSSRSRASGRLPGVRQRGHDPGRWRWLLPYMPRYFERLDLDGYELVVSSSHACAAGVRTAPETLHACYCHTPMRYVWMPEAERNRVGGVKGAALRGAARAAARAGTGAPPQRPGPLHRQLDGGRRPDQALLRPRGRDRAPAGRRRRLPARRAARPDRASSGSTAWCPTSARSRSPRRSASCPTCASRWSALGPLEARAARAAAAQRRAARLGLARAPGGAVRRRRRASSTSARRTSASRWSRRWPPARRCSAPTRGGARDIVRPERDGVLISDPADPRADPRRRARAGRARLGRRRPARAAPSASRRSASASGSPRRCARRVPLR